MKHATEYDGEVQTDIESTYPDEAHRYANLLGYHNGKTRREPLSPVQFIALMDASRP